MSSLVKDIRDLSRLPRVEDSISFVYAEHCVIEQDNFSIMLIDEDGKVPIPIAQISCLLLGPGTSITHAAIKVISECGCLVVWCGENLRKFYAYGAGETRSSTNLQKQVILWCESRLDVVRRMYAMRFPKMKTDNLTLKQLRGMEGARVKQTYQFASKMYGVPWRGRVYKINDIDDSDDINRALTLANDLLYAVCESVIVALGYSPALGFIHTGNMRSFVYDIADLYKTQITIPSAFEAVKINSFQLDETVRRCCRKRIKSCNLMKTMPKDIESIFDIETAIKFGEGLWSEGTVVQQSKDYSKEMR